MGLLGCAYVGMCVYWDVHLLGCASIGVCVIKSLMTEQLATLLLINEPCHVMYCSSQLMLIELLVAVK